MEKLVAEVFVVVAALVLVAALVPVNGVVALVPSGSVRHRWRVLQTGILCCVAAYSTYLVFFWERHRTWFDLIAPAAFLAAALLTVATARLALETAKEVRHTVRSEREGVTDALVGVYNRRYLEHRLSEEVARSKRHALPLSVLLFDLDHFRRLNEKWGREVGDRVLNYLGHLLLNAVRESDVVARYGGEELIVIAPNTTLDQGLELADRLRRHVEQENLGFGGEAGDKPELQVTVSVGVAQFEAEEDEWSEMVTRADQALTRAKKAGRNRVAS